MRQTTNYKFNRTILVALMLAFLAAPSVSAKGVAAQFMEDSVATFYDAAKLIYYSFRSNDKNKKDVQDTQAEAVKPENIKKYLRAKGLDISFDSTPITREHFAETLIERFKLKKSFSTSLFGLKSMYFSDAQDMGIFARHDQGNQAMSTRAMLNAFFKAQHLGSK